MNKKRHNDLEVYNFIKNYFDKNKILEVLSHDKLIFIINIEYLHEYINKEIDIDDFKEKLIDECCFIKNINIIGDYIYIFYKSENDIRIEKLQNIFS